MLVRDEPLREASAALNEALRDVTIRARGSVRLESASVSAKGHRLGRKQGRRARRVERGGRVSALLAGFFLGRPLDGALRERMQEIKGLAFVALSVWLLVSLARPTSRAGTSAATRASTSRTCC
jgi:hypothetical protein